MPKEQFYNLSNEKQDILINAAKEEFSRAPFELASINQIVKKANISRGSFYIYFEDKMDLLKYIMEDYKKGFDNILNAAIIECNGNIFEIFISIFNYVVAYITTNDDFEFVRNIFANLKIHSEIDIPKPNNIEINKLTDIIKEKIVTNNINIKDDIELVDLIEILISVTKASIVDIAFFNKDVECVRKRYINKLEIIENGIYR